MRGGARTLSVSILARARVAHRVVDEAHDQQRQHHDAEVRVCGGGARGESRPLYGTRGERRETHRQRRRPPRSAAVRRPRGSPGHPASSLARRPFLFVCGLNFTTFKLRLGGAARGRTASSRSSRWNEPLSTVAPAVGPQRSSNVSSEPTLGKLSCSSWRVRGAEFCFRPITPLDVATMSVRTPPGLGASPSAPVSHTQNGRGLCLASAALRIPVQRRRHRE